MRWMIAQKRVLINISRCYINMDLRDVFAANIRRLRHAKRMSQDDLAYDAGVSRSYLSQLEKGAFYASLKIIARLAKSLEVEPAELLRRPGVGPRRK